MISLLSSALLAAALAAAQVAVPPLKTRVTDLTGTLDAQQRSALEQTLAEFESRKGSQIAVLLVSTTKPETAFDYGVRVFDAWKLGRKGVDDGVLLLVAKEDRQLRIVTGRGVEGVLTDAVSRRVIEEDITPRFRQGDFYGGIRAGADRIMRLIEGESFPPHEAPAPRGVDFDVGTLVFFLFFFTVVSGILRAIFGRVLGAGIGGGAAGFVVWLVLSSFAIATVAGVVVFLISLIGFSRLGRGSGGGWSSGGGGWSSGGGGWSSGGGGGGFSGGGGSTAGGGAGGSW